MINSEKISGSVTKRADITGEVSQKDQIAGSVMLGGKTTTTAANAVLYIEQALSDEQARQARENIKTVGESVEGTTYVPYTVEEIDGYNYNFIYEDPVVAQEGSEIFNDYNNIAAGLWSTAAGYETQALGNYSITSGWWTRADPYADGNWYDYDYNAYASILPNVARTYYASKFLAADDDDNKVFVRNGTLRKIAVALRHKNGKSDSMLPSEFAEEILLI